MKEADMCGRNESAVKSESAASVQSKSLVVRRPQNPLIPPAGGYSDAPGWWRPVAGDSNSLSTKLTAMLIPVLLTVLILVLLKDYFARGDFANSHRPVVAGFVARTQVEEEPDAFNMEPAESVAPAMVRIGQPPLQVETMAQTVAEVEQEAVIPDDSGVEREATPNTGCQIACETDVECKTHPASETEPKPEVVTVNGILYSGDNPSAIIGGRIVHVGDIVLDATVVGITRDRVLFEKPGQKWGRRVQEAVEKP
jgi:hypothetical protein